MSEPTGLAEKVLVLVGALEQAELPCALGGALALAYHAEPRATVDIDVNVFVPPSRWYEVAAVLAGIGVDVEAVDAAVVARDGQVRCWWDRTPVDVFLAYDPLHAAIEAGSIDVPFGGRRVAVMSATHLVVCKALFDRRKDWLDIEQILVGSAVDLDEVREWLDRFLAPDDGRCGRLDAAVAAIEG